MMRLVRIAVACLTTASSLVFCSELYPQIPAVASFTAEPKNTPPFLLEPRTQIIVDTSTPSFGSDSPALLEFARTFRNDLISITRFSLPPVVSLTGDSFYDSNAAAIHLSLDESSNYTYYSGERSLEGYSLNITSSAFSIKGAAPIGVWWGTRTLLQQVALALASTAADSKQIEIAAGSGSDSPGWEVRGFMLDAGRHWFEVSFLADLCIYASFFKIQSFHIHASDNLWDPSFLYSSNWRALYSGFRFLPSPDSSISGLVPPTLVNETWSQADFSELKNICANHGVTIIPEIDTPGHSLGITKWMPELMIEGQPDKLNLSHPSTIPIVKAIWDEFLPWFNDEVSIGADEYDSSLADDYIDFVNEMAEHISTTSGKKIRVWGTYEPSSTRNISKNVTIQHWDFPDSSVPLKLLGAGYKVINSEQSFLYLDGKTSDGGQFPWELDLDLMFGTKTDSSRTASGWAPHIFSSTDLSNNTTPFDPNLRGAIMALWNDWGNNATTPLEIYYQLARSLAVFGEKTWSGSGVRPTSELTREQFDFAYPILNSAAPGQNLNRAIGSFSNGNVIFNYPGELDTPMEQVPVDFSSVGPPYTLSFSINPCNSTTGVLFAGPDSNLLNNLAFEDPTTRILYKLAGYDGLPSSLDQFTHVTIKATREWTIAIIEEDMYWYETSLDIWGEYMKAANMSFAAPLESIGVAGFEGKIRDVKVVVGV